MSPPFSRQAVRWFARRQFEWSVDYFDGRRINGWVGCRRAPKSPCVLSFRSGGGIIATTLANNPRPDVELVGYDPAGFSCVFDRRVEGPIALAALNPAVRSSWRVLEPDLDPGVGCGAIEALSPSCIRGWAFAPGQEAEESVEVALWEGDHKIAATQANLKRQDVAEGYRLDHPYVGFELRLPIEATAFSKQKFVLRAHYGAKTSSIRKDIIFADIDPAFESQLTLDRRSSSWVSSHEQ